MNAKFSLAIIALVGIGVFALPSTMSLFAGQHSFYNIDATGNQVPCQKCHGDVKAELSSGYSSTTGTPGPHANFKCEYCHRTEAGLASGDDAYAKITYTSVTNASQRLSLVTTIENYEAGNFPYSINYVSGTTTVDNWAGSIFRIDGSPFINRTEFSDSQGHYAGSLQPNSLTGTYNYSSSGESATESNGAPIDTNPLTKNNAFNPRAVNWSGSSVLLDGAGSRMVTPGTRYHAASLVSCLECHGGDQNKGVAGYQINTPKPYNHANFVIDKTDPTNSKCANCHYGDNPDLPSGVTDQLQAGGFGLTSTPNDTGEVEAHKSFVTTNDGMDRFGYGASNGACIACHTHVAVDINFKKGYKLSFDANEDQQGNYDVGNFAVEGHVNIAVYGNASGDTFATGNRTYNWTSGQTMYINGNGSQVVGLGTAGTSTNDSAAALSSGK